ncbi:hypothetical protein NPIL_4871 [Nephila pilipes]|uniref:Uncharacterized protein n=1 Tax=Nephila pilipes TaxID=299642 RepID=A0A8X6TVH7_NEPPI|nr:hypothetical protein NPIL_630501 [Nephila pilipes]GFT50713.1 hypothetical protein NPIL_4871 [Nephila pilipes]
MELRSKDINDGAVWTCRNRINKQDCGSQKSIMFGSWSTSSKLTMGEIFFLTYLTVKKYVSMHIIAEYSFSSSTMVEWRQFMNEINSGLY